VEPRAGVDAVARRKISWFFRELNPGRPAPGLVTILTDISGLLKMNTQENEVNSRYVKNSTYVRKVKVKSLCLIKHHAMKA
jgi:hypothetical protein